MPRANQQGAMLGTTRRTSGLPGRALSLAPIISTCGPRTTKNENRIVINVSGVRYETYKSTLKNIPDTRLSWLTETNETNADYDPDAGEYFFDRHPGVFLMVLNYYRTGKLHAPSDICGPLFEEELAFWGIDEKQIEPCCWATYRTHRDAQETLRELEGVSEADISDDEHSRMVAERFGIQEVNEPPKTCFRKYRPRIWTLLEEPKSSMLAQVVAIISVFFVVLSIATFCMETHISFRVPRNESVPLNSSWSRVEKNMYSWPHQAIVLLDYVCIAYFTMEFLLRVTITPKKREFFKGILNWVDLLAIIPFYMEKILIGLDPSLEHSVFLEILKTLKLVRIFRIFKLTRHFSGLKILAHSIKASAKELILLILFLVITVLIFASLIYFAESVEDHELNDFKNIPIGFWWAVVTMTTLGYGDMHPRTGLGYLVGGLCAISGVLVLALPVPVIVNNFALYYSHAQARLKLPKKRKKVLIGAADQLKVQTTLPGALETPPASEAFNSTPTEDGDTENTYLVESAADSDDSGVTTPDSNRSDAPPTGISVIFTDDLTDKPSSVTPNSLQVPQAGVKQGNGTVPNGMVFLTVTPDGSLHGDSASNQPHFDTGQKSTNRNSLQPSSAQDKTNQTKRKGPPPRRHSVYPRGYKMADVDV